MGKKKKTAKIGRPPKPPDSAKSRYLQVRVQEAERETFIAAAQLHGLDVSAWVRMTLRAAAKRDLRDSGEGVPFLEKK